MTRNPFFALLATVLLATLLAAAPASAQTTLPDFDHSQVVTNDGAGVADTPDLQDSLPTEIATAAADPSAATDAQPTTDGLDAITLTTNKGCDAGYSVGELMRASWSVTDGDYYRLSVATDQGTSLPLGNVWYRYTPGMTYYVDAQISAGPEVRTLRLEGYYTGALQTCAYNVGATGQPPSEPLPPSEPPAPAETHTYKVTARLEVYGTNDTNSDGDESFVSFGVIAPDAAGTISLNTSSSKGVIRGLKAGYNGDFGTIATVNMPADQMVPLAVVASILEQDSDLATVFPSARAGMLNRVKSKFDALVNVGMDDACELRRFVEDDLDGEVRSWITSGGRKADVIGTGTSTCFAATTLENLGTVGDVRQTMSFIGPGSANYKLTITLDRTK